MNPRGSRESGASPIASLLVLVLGGGVVMVVIALFATGLAQKEILPRFTTRAERAVAAAKAKGEAAANAASQAVGHAPKDSLTALGRDGLEGLDGDLANARGSAADSLFALRTQLDTERASLETERRELREIRAEVDRIASAGSSAQGRDVARTAKLLAGMRPEEAARILAAMDDESVAALLEAMNARAASKVLAKLDARRAARLSLAAITDPFTQGDAPSEGNTEEVRSGEPGAIHQEAGR